MVVITRSQARRLKEEEAIGQTQQIDAVQPRNLPPPPNPSKRGRNKKKKTHHVQSTNKQEEDDGASSPTLPLSSQPSKSEEPNKQVTSHMAASKLCMPPSQSPCLTPSLPRPAKITKLIMNSRNLYHHPSPFKQPGPSTPRPLTPIPDVKLVSTSIMVASTLILPPLEEEDQEASATSSNIIQAGTTTPRRPLKKVKGRFSTPLILELNKPRSLAQELEAAAVIPATPENEEISLGPRQPDPLSTSGSVGHNATTTSYDITSWSTLTKFQDTEEDDDDEKKELKEKEYKEYRKEKMIHIQDWAKNPELALFHTFALRPFAATTSIIFPSIDPHYKLFPNAESPASTPASTSDEDCSPKSLNHSEENEYNLLKSTGFSSNSDVFLGD